MTSSRAAVKILFIIVKYRIIGGLFQDVNTRLRFTFKSRLMNKICNAIFTSMNIKKSLTTLLCAIYIAYSCPIALMASTISGVTPQDNTYNIEAAQVSGSTGFRQYDTFDLTDGDIANLVYKDSYDKFLNLVDSRISINGIVNTVKDNNFYNGMAIFVSPDGIVIGSSGVLNVGSLSLLGTSGYDDLRDAYDDSDLSGYEYGANGYKDLVAAADGSIVSNGIILARGNVEADAATIEISGAAGENGIVAGWDDPAMTFSDRQTAVEFFQAIVSADVPNATQMVMNDDGTIRLSAYTTQTGDSDKAEPDNGITSSVDLDSTVLLAKEIDINAKSELGSATLPIVDIGKGVYFDYSKAKISIDSSTLAAQNVKIRADAATISKINAIELPEVLLAWLIEAFEDPEQLEDDVEMMFSSEYYDNFAGARAYTDVDIDNSTITADKNLEVTTDAQTYYEVRTTGAPEEAIPFQSMFHALGTETESKVNVEKSTLTATEGIADLKALSGNSLQVQISNDNGMFRLSETDAFSFQYMNLATSVDTEVNITNSAVRANEISARTLSNVDNWFYVENTATVLKNDFSSATQGGSGAAVMAVVNNSKSKNEVNITGSTLESTGKDKNLSIEAVSVQNMDTSMKVRTDAKGAKKKEKIDDENSWTSKIKSRFDSFTKIGKNAMTKFKQFSYNSWFNIFKMVKDKWAGKTGDLAQNAVGKDQSLDPGLFQVGGSFLFSNNTTETSVNIKDSTLTSAQDLDVTSHLLDKYHNLTMASAKEPEDASQSTAIIGAGIALTVNNRENTNNIVIDNSALASDRDVNINAVTELPGNGGNLGLSSSMLTLGLGFSTDASDDWEFTFNKDIGDSDREGLAPWIGLTGFFNNASAAGTTGDKLAVAASVTYNNGTNSTKVDIRNGSEIVAGDTDSDGNVRVNSATSVATRSDAGFFGSSSIINYDEAYDVWNSDGTGASVLVQTLENNAEVNVEDSEITATADAGLHSAIEQSYINFVKMFTDAPTIALGGAVSVQDYTGTTAVNITENTLINADNIQIEAGKARVSLGKLDFDSDKKGLPLIENDRLVLSDRRTANDHITTIDVIGELSKQESEEKKEVTAAVGAAVNVHTIDRDVKTVIDSATLNAVAGDVTVNTTTYTRNGELALAGSLAGGAAAQTQNVAEWQKKASKSDKSEDFFESMLAKIDDAFPQEEVEEIEEGVEAAKDAASNVGGSKYSFAIAGSVNVLDNSTKVNNYVRNGASVTATGEVDILANLKNEYLILSGGFAKSGTVGTGAAVNFLSRDGNVNSFIGGTPNDGDATVISSGTKTSIDANEDNEIVSIAVGVGYTGDDLQPTDFDGAIGGSFTYNAIESTVASTVNGAALSGNSNDGTDVSVHAKQGVNTLNFAGSLAYESGSKFSAGAALAATADYLSSEVGATVENADISDKSVNDLTILAEENDDLFAIGIALEAVGNYAKYGTPFDGSLGLVVLENDINSGLEDSLVKTEGELSVKADNQVKVLNAEGDGAYSGATSGLGIGGGWVFDIQDNKISATIDTGTESIAAHSATVEANSFEKIENFPITVGISKSTSMLASTVVVDLVTNEVKATAKGTITTGSTADVKAKDETYLITRGGTLAASGSQGTAVLGASVNVDKLAKSVDASLDGADVNAKNKVTVSAESVDANGGTRKDDGTYDRDDISSPDYQEKLLVYDDTTKQYTDINRDDPDTSFKDWNMFYNLGAGAKSAFTGAVVVKFTENNVNAELKNQSKVTSDEMLVRADERIVKSLIIGSISATQNLGVGVNVIYTEDAPVVNARITDGSTADISKDAAVSASDIKDNNTVEVAGSFAGEGGALDLNVVLNEYDDQVASSIDSGSTLNVQSLTLDADEDVNSTRVLVQVSGSENVAVGLEPLVNNYNEKVSATIDSSTVTAAEDSAVAIAAETAKKTRDIAIGVAAAAQGVTLTGVEIRNNYDNSSDAAINASTITDAGDVKVDAGNFIYADNWAVLLDGTAQGVEIGANVMINDVKKSANAQVKDSDVTAKDNVVVRTNYASDDSRLNDIVKNTTGTLGLTGQGAAMDANLLVNTFSDTSRATISGGRLTAGNLEMEAGTLRTLDNTNITFVLVAEGAGLGGSVTYNNIASDTEVLVSTADDDYNISGSVGLQSEDTSFITEVTGTGAAGAIGGAAMANVVVVKEKGSAKTSITGTGNGTFKAGSIEMDSLLNAGIFDESAGVSVGIGALAGNVKLVTVGEKTDYTDLEKNAGLDSAVSAAEERVKDNLGRSLTDDNATGAFSDISGNVSATDVIHINAKSDIGGTSGDRMTLDNIDVSVSGGSAGVGVLSAGFYHTAAATISGGNISAGNVTLFSNTEDSVDVTSHGTDIGALVVTGGSASYNNNSNSVASISDATVKAGDISVSANNTTDTSEKIAGVSVGGVAVNVAGYESNVNYTSNALVTGNVYITADSLELKSDSTVSVASSAQFDAFTGGTNVIYIDNTVDVSGQTNALVKDADGSLDVKNLYITTGHEGITADGSSNVISVSGLSGTFVYGGANVNASFTSGIDNLDNDLKITADEIDITTAKANTDKAITAKSEIGTTGVSLLGLAYADSGAKSTSNTTSDTVVRSNNLTAGKMSIEADLDSRALADDGGSAISTLLSIQNISVESDATDTLSVEFGGNITAGSLDVTTNHNTTTSVNAKSVAAALFGSVSYLEMKSDNNATTSVTLGGTVNADDADFQINTNRYGQLDSSSNTGGAISVSTRKFHNHVTGTTQLVMDGLKAYGTGDFKFNLAPVNTHDDVSISSSGGFFAHDGADYDYNFDTKSNVDIKDSKISGYSNVGIGNVNSNVIKDTNVTQGGGFIFLSSSKAGNTYSSSSDFTVEDSTISADTVTISTQSGNATDVNQQILFKAESGGFYTGDGLELDNTLNQKNNLSIKNSSITGKDNVTVALMTTHSFYQKVEDISEGFIANPTVKSTITSNNTNTLDIDEGSTVKSDGDLDFTLDVSGNLGTISHVQVEDCGSDPETQSHLAMNADNTMTLEGTAEGGNSTNVVFMGNANNDLHQESYSEHFAVAPFTTEGGELKRIVNNTLTVASSGRMLAGNSLNYQFNDPTGNIYASNHYHLIYYAAFGYETYGETSSNKTLQSNNKADVPGKMAAGISNGKFLFVAEDGSVDKDKSSGVYESDYFTYGDGKDPTPSEIKEKVVADIRDRIGSLNDSLDQVNAGLEYNEERYDEIQAGIAAIDSIFTSVDEYLDNGYEIVDESTILATIRNDMIYELSTDDKHPPISGDVFETVLANYTAWVKTEEAQGTGIVTDMVYYVTNVDTILDAGQRETFVKAAGQINDFMSHIVDTDGMNGTSIMVYTNAALERKYIVTSLGTGESAKDMLAILEQNRNVLADQITALEKSHDVLASSQALITADIASLNNELDAAVAKAENEYGQSGSSYALLFQNHNVRPGSITITGIEAGDVMVGGERVGENLSLLKDHVYTPHRDFVVSNKSDRDVIVRLEDSAGNDGIRFTVNGTDISDYVTVSGSDAVTFKVHNDDISVRDDADVQLYTAQTGSFNFYVDDAGVVHTTAPVIYSRPGLLVQSYLGYHSFDSLGYAEAANLNSGILVWTDFVRSSDDEDEEPITSELRRDASVR